MRRKLSLFDYFHIVAFIMFTTFTALFLFFTLGDIKLKFEKEAQLIEEKQLEVKKNMLEKEVQRFVDFIDYKKERIYAQTQALVKTRVDEAYNVARHIYDFNKGKLPDEAIQKEIIETLRIMRFEQGKGYYFITSMNGVEMLFSDKPEMEGKNMLRIKNSEGRYVVKGMIDLVHASSEGFYEYAWSKPNEREENFRKIAYVKLFEPFGWFIGTGLYLDDMEAKIKEEIINDTDRLLFDKETNNYIFAGTWNGVSLTYPAQGKNMYNIQDSNGMFIVQELISRAQSGGGVCRVRDASFKR